MDWMRNFLQNILFFFFNYKNNLKVSLFMITKIIQAFYQSKMLFARKSDKILINFLKENHHQSAPTLNYNRI